MKYCLYLFFVFGLVVMPSSFAQADHYGSVFEEYEQCNDDCEDDRERAIEALDCDYYGTQSAYQSCERSASAARRSCLSSCGQVEDETVSACKSTYREDKKQCRDDKGDETQECRDAKKAEKDMCKQNKIDEKEACKELSGRAKRDCKKQARENKRECKKQARQTKKACKKDARDDKKDCKEGAKETRDSCINTAENVARECSNSCNNTYEAACLEERQAFNACSSQAQPIFNTESVCKEVCDDEKAEGLEGYNPSCSNDHAGDEGAVITFYNRSGAVRHYYRPEPYPTVQPTGPLTMNMTYVTSLDPGETYEQPVVCGVPLTFHFKDNRTEGSNFVGQEFPLPAYPCCEVAVQTDLPIDR